MSDTSKPIIWIAEIGQNHRGDINLLKHLVHKTIEAGASFVKFQLYNTNSIFDGSEPYYEPTLQAEVTKSQSEFIGYLVKQLGGRVLFSPFDEQRTGWSFEVLAMNYPNEEMYAIKLASRAAHDKNILTAIEAFKLMNKKKLLGIVSHGMRTFTKEKYASVFDEQLHLYCKSEYPCTYTEENWLDMMESFRTGALDGLSDHSIGTAAIERAISIGARVVEKHITYLDAPEARYEAFKAKGGNCNCYIPATASKPKVEFSFEEWIDYDRRTNGPDHVLSITPGQLCELIEKYKH